MGGWDIAANIVNLVGRFPFERLLDRGPNDKALDALEKRLSDKGLLKPATQFVPLSTVAKQPLPAVAQGGSTGVITRSDLDLGTLAYQEDMALGEAYLLEDHLKRGCRGCGDDVDCCWKTADKLSRYAHETMSMTTDPFWQNLMALAEEIKAKSHPDDVKAGTYAAEYPGYAVRVSEFRRPLQKRAMARVSEPITLEKAKAAAAELAQKEVEKEWQSTEKT
jgi:hypothetical protein